MNMTEEEMNARVGMDGWVTVEGGLRCHVDVVELRPSFGHDRILVRDDFGTEVVVNAERFQPRKGGTQ